MKITKILLTSVALLATTHANAISPFTPGSIVVNSQTPGVMSYKATEYNLQGGIIQTFSIPQPPGQTEYLNPRDMAFTNSNQLHIYNGTFNPYLSSYDSSSDTWTNRTSSGWSTVNNGSYGGIAAWNTSVFVTDMPTYGGEAQGVIAFDTVSGASTRFASNLDPVDLNVGQDGKLYVLDGSSSFGGVLNFV